MKKIKVGKGYKPTNIGKGFQKNSIVWLINDKAYVKDSRNKTYQTDLIGYTMVNYSEFNNSFHAVSTIHEHKKYNNTAG